MADQKRPKRYTVEELMAEMNSQMPIGREWDEMRPVGIEFGAEIQSDDELESALRQIDELSADPEADSAERLNVLRRQVDAYHRRLAGEKDASAW